MITLRALDEHEKFHDRQASLRPGHSSRKARRHQEKANVFKMAKALLRASKKRKAS